jgi:hypothetical protein
MASPIIIPFDTNPSTISKKTASYTVPSGKFAHVKVNSPRFFINGVAVYPTSSARSYASTAGGANTANQTLVDSSVPVNVHLLTVNKSGDTRPQAVAYGYIMKGQAVNGYGGTTQSFASGSRNSNGTTNFPTDIDLSGTFVLQSYCVIYGIAYADVYCYYYYLSGDTSFVVPSGTVLDGSEYVVQEYNAIS